MPRRSRPTARSLHSSACDGRRSSFPSAAPANTAPPQALVQPDRARRGGCACRGAQDQQHAHFTRARAMGGGFPFPRPPPPTPQRRSLWGNGIGTEGAAALAEALKTNSTLTSLECVRWAAVFLSLGRPRQHRTAAGSSKTRSGPRGRLRLPRHSRPTARSLRSGACDGRRSSFPSAAPANTAPPQALPQPDRVRGGGCACRGAQDQQHAHFARVRAMGGALPFHRPPPANTAPPQPQRQRDRGRGGGCAC